MKKGAKQRAIEFKVRDDGTYYALTGENVEKDPSFVYCGFQFSFVRPEAYDNLNDNDWDYLTEHIMDKVDSIEYVGVYENIPETSFRAAILEQAMSFAEMFNQINILDWAIKKIYPNQNDWREWYRDNNNFDEGKKVDYDSIVRKIRANN